MTSLKKQYENQKPIGYYAVSAFWGVAVYDYVTADITDYVITAIINEGEAEKFTVNKVDSTKDGKLYFRKCGMRIYLNEVLAND